MSSSSQIHLIVGDKVVFNSIHGDFSINGESAIITEISNTIEYRDYFPHNVSFCIQFESNLRKTWCRLDELTRI